MTNTTHIYNLDELQDRRIMMDKKLPPYGYALIILTGFLMVYLLLWSTKNYRTYVSQSTGTVEITFTGDYAAYSRIYLYNTVASKWQFLNAFKDNTLGADTAGEYLLTTENLRFAEMDWTFFIAGGFVMIGIVVAYIVVKKRYWFW